ncbi:SRPBCC family protein [Pseudofulvibacter geojedonensis]|uniref:GyrI-like domain-containing protein n=1 Tax=Pseudofulvibacter geojedonensis TaxID=1123758 RepID=A0ABW3I2L0_9FLAO
MKIVKYLLILIVVVVLGYCILAAMQPSSYNFERSRIIKAPIEYVYKHISDYKKCEAWGPWQEQDTTMTFQYSDQTSGVGARYSWNGAWGPGSMKTLEAIENKSLKQELKFAGFEPSEVNWSLEETDEGTKVTWGMKGNSDFKLKAMMLPQGGMEKANEASFLRGLEKLDSIVVDDFTKNPPAPPAPTYSLGGIMKLDQEAQQFIGYKQNMKIDHEAMTKLFMEFLPKAGMHAVAQKMEEGDYTPGAVFTKWDEKAGEAEFYIGLVVKKDIPLADGMEKITLPKGNNIMMSKYGPYGTGDHEAHMAIDAYLKENGLEQNGPIWELYVNDPSTVKPEEIETEIHYPVK